MNYLYQYWNTSHDAANSLGRLLRRNGKVTSVEIIDSDDFLKHSALSSLADGWGLSPELMTNYDAAFDTICDALLYKQLPSPILEVCCRSYTASPKPAFCEFVESLDRIFSDAFKWIDTRGTGMDSVSCTLLLMQITPHRAYPMCIRDQ